MPCICNPALAGFFVRFVLMCTVSYLPTDDGFIITSNRDENPERSADPPAVHEIASTSLLFPKEPLKGGTWIAASRRRIVCLLNGAYIRHSYQPPYRLSRGIMLLESFGYSDDFAFAGRYPFAGIEPFTLVWAAHESLSEIRWDGKTTHHTLLSPFESHIWASATLYDAQTISLRRNWFDDFIQKTKNPSLKEIFAFHTTPKGIPAENDIIMIRPNVRTISVTAFEMKGKSIIFEHKDLLKGELHKGIW